MLAATGAGRAAAVRAARSVRLGGRCAAWSTPLLRRQSTKAESHHLHASELRTSSSDRATVRGTDAARVQDEPASIAVLEETLQELQAKPVDFHYYLRSLHKIQRDDKLPYKFGLNQMHSESRNGSSSGMENVMSGILNRFKEEEAAASDMDYAFGYGSKIFSQGENVDISNSQIDMIYAVRDPVEWHRRNIEKNGEDYSILKYFGPHAIDYVAKMGAGVYFNPFVNINVNDMPLELKYGVTSTENLADDLTNWSSMYLAGRLHKPVAIVENTPQLLFLNQFNLSNAVKLSILLLNQEKVTESELFLTIAGLSYMGDPRLKVKGENPDKVKNIVDNQFPLFRKLYQPILDHYFPEILQSTNADTATTEKVYSVNLSQQQIANIIIELPRQFRSRMLKMYTKEYENAFAQDRFAQSIINNPKHHLRKQSAATRYSDVRSANHISELPATEWEYMTTNVKVDSSPYVRVIAREFHSNPKLLKHALSSTIETTVGESALVQSVKGILTAGIVRSWKYALAKRRKYMQALKKRNQK